MEEFEKILTSVLMKMTSCVLEVVFAFHEWNSNIIRYGKQVVRGQPFYF